MFGREKPYVITVFSNACACLCWMGPSCRMGPTCCIHLLLFGDRYYEFGCDEVPGIYLNLAGACVQLWETYRCLSMFRRCDRG
jgi:hypothetical protein